MKPFQRLLCLFSFIISIGGVQNVFAQEHEDPLSQQLYWRLSGIYGPEMPKIFVPFPRFGLTYSVLEFPRLYASVGLSLSNVIVIPTGGYFFTGGVQLGYLTLECTYNTYAEGYLKDEYSQRQLTPSVGLEWNNWFVNIGPTFVLAVNSNYSDRNDRPFPRNFYPFIHLAGLDWNIEIGYRLHGDSKAQ